MTMKNNKHYNNILTPNYMYTVTIIYHENNTRNVCIVNGTRIVSVFDNVIVSLKVMNINNCKNNTINQ